MSSSFSRDEIAKIMSKATQIQAQMDKYGEHETLTQEELLELGQDIGVSSIAILEALNEVETESKEKPRFSWLKGTSLLYESRLIPGRIDEENWDAVVAQIRETTGGIGKLIRSKSTFEWEQRRQEVGYRHITFTQNDGHTKLSYSYNWLGINVLISAVGTVLTMALFAIISKGVFGNEYKSIAALAGIVSGFLGGRLYLYSYFKEQRKKFEKLTKSLSSLLKRNSVSNPLLETTLNEKVADESKNNRTKNRT